MSPPFNAIEELFGARSNTKADHNVQTSAPSSRHSALSNPALEPIAPDQRSDKRPGALMTQPKDLIPILEACFNNVDIAEDAKTAIIRTILLNVREFESISRLQQRLEILYQHEKNYLTLIKDFKEEIKFIGSMQEDLRKERARFFSDTLKEVTEALNDSKVSDEVASQWLEELVGTYTHSLDLSVGLIEEHTADIVSEIRAQAQELVNTATADARDDEPN
jgi:hypothetical protein